MAIFIPKNIRVGYQNRSDTFSGKLSFPIYYDAKGKIRKEPSFNGWRDDTLPVDEYENVPMEGFILNRTAGGGYSGWDKRNTYCRVFHPLGFEFEIGIENLLFVLEHCESRKGKKIQGEIVMGWDGKDHMLVPVDSPEYQNIKNASDILNSGTTIRKGSDLNVGTTYKTKQNCEYTYLGKFKKYDEHGKDKKNHYWFYDTDLEGRYSNIEIKKSLGDLLINVITHDKHKDFDKQFKKMEFMREYSPEGKNELIPIDKKRFVKVAEKYHKAYNHKYNGMFATADGTVFKIGFNENGEYVSNYFNRYAGDRDMTDVGKYYVKRCVTDRTWGYFDYHCTNNDTEKTYYDSLEEMYDVLTPCYKKTYLQNGKLNQVEFSRLWTNIREVNR